MKTFVYHDGALGDTLLSLPCFKSLKGDAGLVHVAGRGDVVRFLRDAGVVDAATSSDQALFASLYTEIDPRLRTFLSRFDRACVFASEEYPAAAAAIRTVIPRTFLIRTIPPDGSRIHAAQYRFSQLDPDAVFSERYTVLRVPPEKVNVRQSLLREAGYSPGMALIAVHPGSGGRLKCWPLERYLELIEALQSKRDAFVILFMGDAEDGKLRETACRFARVRKNMLYAADFELVTAASLLLHCSQYIGNDSGFSHLAGLLGCNTIILFGPTDPFIWKPLGPRVETVSTGAFGPMTQIMVKDVIAKADSAFHENGSKKTGHLLRSVAK